MEPTTVAASRTFHLAGTVFTSSNKQGKEMSNKKNPTPPTSGVSNKYKPLQTRCNLTVTSIRFAAQEGLKPSSVYTLHVGARSYYDGKDVAAHGMDPDNPFSPYINLIIDPDLGRDEWYVSYEHGNAVGTEGC